MDTDSSYILKDLSRHKVGLSGDILLRNAVLHGNRPAFIYGNRVITFKQYNERVNSLIHALYNMEVKKSDVVAVLSWNCLEYADVFGAAGKGGFIFAPLNVRSSLQELEYLINDCGTSTLFVGPEFADMVAILKPHIPKVKNFINFEKPIPGMEYIDNLFAKYESIEPDIELDDDSPLLLLYTSGTTGVPKGALYTQIQWREDILTHCIEMPIEPDDRGLLIMPYFHIGGAIWHAVFVHRAACNVIMKYFEPETVVQTIYDKKITSMCIVPTHLATMLNIPGVDKYDLSILKRVKYVGSPMPLEVLKKAINKWGLIFFQGYGQTESGPDIAFLKENDHNVLQKSVEEQNKLKSAGKPALDVHVRIVDEHERDVAIGEVGEIIVRSRHLMKGYWNKPDETNRTIISGWLHTGDIGCYDDEGYIYIVDRKNDMIISGGENIYPREVEEVLYKHPGILECAVFGIPDPKWVETVHAVVSLKQGFTCSAEELTEFCKSNIARYKAPKSIEIVSEIPKGGTGKIAKKELKEKYWK